MTPAAAALASALRTFVDEQMIRVRAAFDAAEGGDDVTAGAWYAWAEREVNAVLNAVSTAVRDSAWHKAAWRTLHDVTPGMDELSGRCSECGEIQRRRNA